MSDGTLTVNDLSLGTHETQRTESFYFFFTKEKEVLFGNGSVNDNFAINFTWRGIK